MTASSNVTFTVAAGGFGSLYYQWYFNSNAISGATTANYTITGAMATNAGTYTVVITNYCGSVTSSVATLTVTKTAGTVTLGSLNQTYNGSAEVATLVTTPSGLTVNLTYNGSANAPTNAGSYTVIGTINDANYQGSATNTLTISKATVSISSGLSANSKTYDGMTSASLSFNSVVLSGVAAGDAANAQLSTNGYTATFANPAAGTAIAVTVSGLTLTGIASANYTFIQPALTANINPAILTITANSATRPFGAPNPVFTAAYSGFVNGEGSSVLSGTLVLSTTATTNSPVGAYPIVPSQATLNSPNYNFNLINGTLTVTEVPVSLALQFVAGTGFQTNQAVLSCAGLTPGNVYRIQASASLTQWSEIGTAQASLNGTMMFADTNAAVYPMRFYRLSSN